jgi:hypothetical protein
VTSLSSERPFGVADLEPERLEGDEARVDVLLEAEADEAERVMPDADDVELLDDRAIDGASVDERAVGAAEVDQFVQAVRARPQLGVKARDQQVVDDDVVLGVTTDARALADRLVDAAEDAAQPAVDDARERHRRSASA